jgi:hypothetical protein
LLVFFSVSLNIICISAFLCNSADQIGVQLEISEISATRFVLSFVSLAVVGGSGDIFHGRAINRNVPRAISDDAGSG